MDRNMYEFYVSFSALLVPIIGAIYFFTKYFQTGKPAFIWWALGMGSLMLFKVPNILFNAGVEIIQSEWYPYFFITLLAYIFSYFALTKGLASISGHAHIVLPRLFFSVLFFGAIFFGLVFLTNSGFPVWVGHVLFFIPAQLFLLHELRRGTKSKWSFGFICTALGVVALLITSMLYIFVQVFNPYPHDFWYIAVISSTTISVVQIAAGLLLIGGLRSIARSS